MGGNCTQRGAKFFAGAIGYSLSVGTTEGEAMDGACVVIANLALRWVGGGYAGFCSYPCPCPPMPHRTRLVLCLGGARRVVVGMERAKALGWFAGYSWIPRGPHLKIEMWGTLRGGWDGKGEDFGWPPAYLFFPDLRQRDTLKSYRILTIPPRSSCLNSSTPRWPCTPVSILIHSPVPSTYHCIFPQPSS
uniref:Uncharacterized protein n=1 Tax=mine drainage metagenome TaxID=410659 RepID=E6Q099_9ZZZZ